MPHRAFSPAELLGRYCEPAETRKPSDKYYIRYIVIAIHFRIHVARSQYVTPRRYAVFGIAVGAIQLCLVNRLTFVFRRCVSHKHVIIHRVFASNREYDISCSVIAFTYRVHHSYRQYIKIDRFQREIRVVMSFGV